MPFLLSVIDGRETTTPGGLALGFALPDSTAGDGLRVDPGLCAAGDGHRLRIFAPAGKLGQLPAGGTIHGLGGGGHLPTGQPAVGHQLPGDPGRGLRLRPAVSPLQHLRLSVRAPGNLFLPGLLLSTEPDLHLRIPGTEVQLSHPAPGQRGLHHLPPGLDGHHRGGRLPGHRGTHRDRARGLHRPDHGGGHRLYPGGGHEGHHLDRRPAVFPLHPGPGRGSGPDLLEGPGFRAAGRDGPRRQAEDVQLQPGSHNPHHRLDGRDRGRRQRRRQPDRPGQHAALPLLRVAATRPGGRCGSSPSCRSRSPC